MNEENVMTTNEMNREERMPFFRIPKVILTDEKYVGLSEDAMLLYGILLDRRSLSERNDWRDKKGDVFVYCTLEASVYKGYKRDKIEMRGDRAEMSDFPLYLNTVAGGLDRRDQTIGGFSFVVKIYAVPVVEIIG